MVLLINRSLLSRMSTTNLGWVMTVADLVAWSWVSAAKVKNMEASTLSMFFTNLKTWIMSPLNLLSLSEGMDRDLNLFSDEPDRPLMTLTARTWTASSKLMSFCSQGGPGLNSIF